MKIYNLNDELYLGAQARLFKIKGKEKLIAKVYKSKPTENAKREFEIGKLFQMNSVSTPKYIGVCKVQETSTTSPIWDAVVMEHIEDSYLIKSALNYTEKQNVPSNMYIRGAELLKKEIKKIEHLPFKLISTGTRWLQDYQGLYSPLRDRIYLIDFGRIRVAQKK